MSLVGFGCSNFGEQKGRRVGEAGNGDMSASAIRVCMVTEDLSLIKLYLGFLELFFNQVLAFRVPCLSLHCPVLARVL